MVAKPTPASMARAFAGAFDEGENHKTIVIESDQTGLPGSFISAAVLEVD
jgi:hypothetical protein